MPREYNIKWRESDELKFRRALKNYNAKIGRLEKTTSGIDRSLLPRKLTAKELRESIQTRKDFNKTIDKLTGFTKRGGEYRFKMREADEKKASALVGKFNAKLTKLEAGLGEKEKAALPMRASIKQLRSIVGTRADFNRELKALERFLKPGAEELVEIPGNEYKLKITKWQMEDMLRRLPGINERREEKRKKLADVDLTDRGKKLGYKKGHIGMGRAEERALDPVEAFTEKMNRPDLRMKHQQLIRESQSDYWDRRDEILRKNFIKGIEENFPTGAEDIISKIEDMNFTEFRKIFEAEGGKFEQLYPPQGEEEYQEYLSALRATWDPQK